MPQVGSIRHFLTQKKQFHVPVQKPHDFRQFCIDQLWLDKQKLCERGGQTIASTHGTENIEKKKKSIYTIMKGAFSVTLRYIEINN